MGYDVPNEAPPVPPEEQKQNPNIKSTLLMTQPGTTGAITAQQDQNGSMQFTTILDLEVVHPDLYMEMIHVIDNLRENDTFDILINSNGGWVETGIGIIHAIRNTKGTVVGNAIGMCASIAAVIWSCCQVRKISPFGTLMFHMPSGGYFGKTMDIADEASEMVTYFGDLLREITPGILTEEDIVEIVHRRKDLFLPAKTVQERLNLIARSKSNEN